MKQLSKQGIEAVGWLTAVPFVLAAIAMYMNASWSDRRGGSRTFFVAIPLFLGGIALFIEHFIGFNLVTNMIVLIVAGIGIYAAMGPWWAWAMSFVPRNQAGTANGLINLVGNFGGIVGPIVVGAVAQKNSNVGDGFYILGFFLMAASIIAVVFGAVLKSRSRTITLSEVSEAKG